MTFLVLFTLASVLTFQGCFSTGDILYEQPSYQFSALLCLKSKLKCLSKTLQSFLFLPNAEVSYSCRSPHTIIWFHTEYAERQNSWGRVQNPRKRPRLESYLPPPSTQCNCGPSIWVVVFHLYNGLNMTCLKAYHKDWLGEYMLQCVAAGSHLVGVSIT